MIFDSLVTTTKAMQDIRGKTAIKNNKIMQDNTDIKYRSLLKQVTDFVDVIEYLYNDLSVPKSKEILLSISELMNSLEQVVESGLALLDRVTTVDSTFKIIQGNMKKEWSKQYVDLTGATISTLEAIKGIEPDRVENCLHKIQSAEIWNLNVKKYQTMRMGLDEAEQLITGLGLDDEIITFLKNASSGKATLENLSDRVSSWIREEHLESKIRISFVKIKIS